LNKLTNETFAFDFHIKNSNTLLLNINQSFAIYISQNPKEVNKSRTFFNATKSLLETEKRNENYKGFLKFLFEDGALSFLTL
jgi:hypothetical protein